MLRDYQEQAVHELRAAVMRSGSAVYVLPTGAGKTVVAAEIARRGAEKGSKTLLLVHRRELVKQAIDTLSEACPGLPVGVEAAGFPAQPWAPLQVGMVQSINRRKHSVEPDVVIVDEGHHARAKTWTSVLNRWPLAVRIALTATPERLDGKGLGEHFAEMVMGPTTLELVAQGYLAPIRTLSIPAGLDLSGIRNDRNGEMRQDDVRSRLTPHVVVSAAEAYQRYAAGKKAIFFGIHREHSRQVCAELRKRGVAAEHVDGDDSMAHRDRIMGLFRDGALQVVGNVDLISEGFDAPACEVVIMGAPTNSVTRFLQWLGRPRRPGPNKVAIALDLVGNCHRLGLPDDEREWSLEDGEITDTKSVAKKPRECVQCATLHYGRICPHCAFSTPMAGIDEVEAELVDAREVVKPKRRKPRMTRKELNRQLAQARRAPNPRIALQEIAKRNGYKAGWITAIERVWAR